MSSVKPTIPIVVPAPANSYPKPSSAPEAAPKPAPTASERQRPPAAAATQAATEHHHGTATTVLTAQALSSTDVSYVESLLGTLPAQKMEEILLKTGVPIPANLGPNIDTVV